MAIHPTALVAPSAELGQDVEIHPFTIVEAGVHIGDRCEIGPQAVVRTGTSLGEDCHISVGVVLGEPPQDRKYKHEETFLHIGSGNLIREYVTIHRATGEGQSTTIGDNNMIMAYSHAGHNVRLGSHCQIANGVQIAGHAIVEDYVNVGGMTGLHQFITIGTMSMVGAMCRASRDVPPYCIVEGSPADIRSVNVIGLERRELSAEVRGHLRQAFRILFRSELNTTDALQAVAERVPQIPEVVRLTDFVRRTSEGNLGRQQVPRQ